MRHKQDFYGVDKIAQTTGKGWGGARGRGGGGIRAVLGRAEIFKIFNVQRSFSPPILSVRAAGGRSAAVRAAYATLFWETSERHSWVYKNRKGVYKILMIFTQTYLLLYIVIYLIANK